MREASSELGSKLAGGRERVGSLRQCPRSDRCGGPSLRQRTREGAGEAGVGGVELSSGTVSRKCLWNTRWGHSGPVGHESPSLRRYESA